MIRSPFPLVAVLAVLTLAACESREAAPTSAAPSTEAEAAAGPAPEMPADAPPQEEAPLTEGELLGAADRTCRDSIGEQASARLVQRCIAVSPATHPPCNAANPCALIQDEIDRSCAMYGPGETKPAECAA